MTDYYGSSTAVENALSFTVSPQPRKRVIYIAGRYRDERGEYYVRCNIREAERAAIFVWLFGGVALCPHKNTSGLGGAHGIADQVWLDGDLELLRRCDAVWALPGWESSQGAQAELAEAQELGLPVLYDQDQVLKFLGQNGQSR